MSRTARLSILVALLGVAAAITYYVSSDDERYFMVLAGRSGTFYDRSGPAFSMAIKATGSRANIDAVGIYADSHGQPVFGAVPAASYAAFLNEPRDASDVMLRFEVAQPEYERGLAILRTWDRRAQEGALLYPDITMDNILLVKQVTESLNVSDKRLELYSLDWGLEDAISEHNIPSHIPFKYFQELRRLNEGRHVRDGDMPGAVIPD